MEIKINLDTRNRPMDTTDQGRQLGHSYFFAEKPQQFETAVKRTLLCHTLNIQQ